MLWVGGVALIVGCGVFAARRKPTRVRLWEWAEEQGFTVISLGRDDPTTVRTRSLDWPGPYHAVLEEATGQRRRAKLWWKRWGGVECEWGK